MGETAQSREAVASAILVRDLIGCAAGAGLTERLWLIRGAVRGRVVFTTSFGLEDQAVTDAIFAAGIGIDVVTLDTGRLFPQTYETWAATERKYDRRIAAIYPDHAAVEALVAGVGIDGFYDSATNRHACCGVRKVAPLARALAGAAGWVTGMRAEQSVQRSAVPFAVHEPARGLVKFNPLHDWTRSALTERVERLGIPINPLHAQGFLSIGCAPCTRAVAAGEPERAGRWWWEEATARECGLHVSAPGKLERAARAA